MQKIFSLEMDDDQKEKGGLKSGGNTIMARPQTTSIVELKPLSKGFNYFLFLLVKNNLILN